MRRQTLDIAKAVGVQMATETLAAEEGNDLTGRLQKLAGVGAPDEAARKEEEVMDTTGSEQTPAGATPAAAELGSSTPVIVEELTFEPVNTGEEVEPKTGEHVSESGSGQSDDDDDVINSSLPATTNQSENSSPNVNDGDEDVVMTGGHEGDDEEEVTLGVTQEDVMDLHKGLTPTQ